MFSVPSVLPFELVQAADLKGIPMKDQRQEEECKAEAERLALLPAADQQEIIALHRSVAANPKVKQTDRQLARDRADALERHLRQLQRRAK